MDPFPTGAGPSRPCGARAASTQPLYYGETRSLSQNNPQDRDNHRHHTPQQLHATPDPRDDVAMKPDRSSHGDERRGRPSSNRDPAPNKSLEKTRFRSPHSHRPPAFHDRDYRDLSPREHQTSPRSRSGRREKARDRSKDSFREAPASSRPFPRRDKASADRTFHDSPAQPSFAADDDDRFGNVPRGRSYSPSSSSKRRRRTRSPLPVPPPKKKKSRRDYSPQRAERGPPNKPGPPRRPRESSPYDSRKPRSPVYDNRRHRHDEGSVEPHRERHRSRSPPRGPASERPNLSRQAAGRRDSYLDDLPQSPPTGSRRSSFSRTHSPGPSSWHRPGSSDGGSFSRRSSPHQESSRPDYPPRSPRDYPPSGRRKKGKDRGDPPPRKRGGASGTGANSVEVSMSRRGEYRGSYGGQGPPPYPARSHYNDSRYDHSPPHMNSGSSHQGSPSQSPYSGSRGNWSGQGQFSPNSQYPPPHSQGRGHGPPTAPQAHFNSGQSPPYPPTGPMQQSFPQGRGFSRGGFRGGGFNSGRGGSRGGSNFKSFGGPPGAGRGHMSSSGDTTPQHASNSNPPLAHPDSPSLLDDHPDEDNPFRPSKDLQVEDTALEKHQDTEQMPPPNRAPPSAPTGPSGSKFSFAFKATSKAPVATPKPEISQKFSAAPPRRDAQPVDDRERAGLPKSTPTEPASSRARAEYHQNHNRHPPEPPRTRKVVKIVRRLKEKPRLPPELAASDSVYYRKSGNESVVGSGTYGKVYKGLHVYTKKLVALKKIRMEGEKDGFPVTAVREIKLLQSLKHVNIVDLQEVMVEKNDCFMVFEYLSHDLTGLLNHPSYKLDPAQKKHLALQMFEGLDYLHKRGVLHRDIKAANILVSNEGVLKLADFGLARFYAKHHQLDYTNRVITIWYRSPELLLGETQYGAAVDVWSAACVMVEIFTRHAIFPGDGGEISQLDKIYDVLGTPNKQDWPGLVDMPWFELLRPSYRKPNVFEKKYSERLPVAAFELLAAMFRYDPVKRPSAEEVLNHPYFTKEQPPPRQAVELATIEGDWHEFESKALRREKEKKEKKEREARRAAEREAHAQEKDKKRPSSNQDSERDAKRPNIEGRPPSSHRPAPNPEASRTTAD